MDKIYTKIDSDTVNVLIITPDTTTRINKRTLLLLKEDKESKLALYQKNVISVQIELAKINICLEELKEK